ncbi:cell wall hydrolase [Sphingomonas crusticola]|uniref:cell wall hydrolase n=1 Tax=Sphingomonas crusticola TaxID=1697973 RepID=UPI000E22DA35|nr:cell wall hydrolase [Sphingomonas crusticola]
MSVSKWRGQQMMLVAIVILIAVGVAVALTGFGETSPKPDLSRGDPGSATTLAFAPPPEVPPTIFAPETPDEARASNAAVPLVTATPTASVPFRYKGSPEDLAAAQACLAAAVLYEAGDDPPGERAVAQVVLNRLRHPAFPKTVCGVIFQGSERKTGCQFTFTCDGSLARPLSAEALARAREIAEAALSGFVYKPVGTATHYHTDWVVPYWRSSLEKIAIVHTQIFYRWPGIWGSRHRLTGQVQPGERPDARLPGLAELAPAGDPPMVASDAALPLPPALTIAGLSADALNGNIVRLKDEEAAQYVLQLDPSAHPNSYAMVGLRICGAKTECTIFGWTSAADIPRSLPILPLAMRSVAFVFRKSAVLGLARASWDCTRFPRPPAQCLR